MEERLACLEFYCRLRPADAEANPTPARGLFTVEEDHRKRTLLRLVPDPYETETKPQQWRCSYALPARATTQKLVQTLGTNVLDWVLDGYNAVVMSMGAEQSGKTYSMLGGFDKSKDVKQQQQPEKSAAGTNSANATKTHTSEVVLDSATSSTTSTSTSLIHSFLREVFRAKRQAGFRVGLSWWTVRGSEVRDQNHRPLFRNITKFEVVCITTC